MSVLDFLGFGRSHDNPPIKSVSAQDAFDKVAGNEVVLIDVREANEWRKTGLPQGAIGVALQDRDFMTKLVSALANDLAQPVCFSCLQGGRSIAAAKKAQQAGITDIYNLEGGIGSWIEAKLPTEPVG